MRVTTTTTLTIIFITLCIIAPVSSQACIPACEHGTCNAGACECAGTGFSGQACEAPVCSFFDGNICSGNGICSAPETCTCNPGYEGDRCQTFVCQAGCVSGQGTCESANNCVCEEGYTGIDCGTPICDPGCQNFGTCVSPGVCNCDTTPGWFGPYCQFPICNATTGLCQHDTPCVGAGVCNCTGTGWVGTQCELDRDECFMKNFTACDPKTKCTNTKGSYRCSACPSGYSGDGKTGCVPNCQYGCMNGGVCSAPNSCNCTGTGFTGAQCFEDLDECAVGGYCDDLSSCINTVGSFMCTGQCPANYTGSVYMSEGGCQPVCLGGCSGGMTCVSPGVCRLAEESGAKRLLAMTPILVAFLVMMWV